MPSISPSQFGKVAVLMGGLTAERDISLKTGNMVFKALEKQGVNAVPIDWAPDVDIIDAIRHAKVDRVFVALHGRDGEDGTIQGVLECLNLPYTGSGVGASSLCMDKIRCKWMWQGLNLPTPAFEVLNDKFDPKKVVNKLGLPIFVKPVNEGSSFGLTKVTNEDELKKAYITASEYDTAVIAEQFIDGREFTVGIVGDETYPVIQIKTPRQFYDYEAKYFEDTTEYLIPSGLTPEGEQVLQSLCLKAYQAAGCHHWGRVDVMEDTLGNFWLLEVNTIPGMTDHSLVPMAAKAAGVGFDQLVLKILALTFTQ